MTESDVKIYLQGLISRDVSCGTPIPTDDPYWDTEEGKRVKAKNERRRDAHAKDELRLVSLAEPGSIKWVEVDRAQLRGLIAEGWVFDDETVAWGNESK